MKGKRRLNMEMEREYKVQQERDSSCLLLSLGPDSHPFLNFSLPEELPRQDIKTIRQLFWKIEGEKSSTLSPPSFLPLSVGIVFMENDLSSESRNHLLHTELHFNKIQICITPLTLSMINIFYFNFQHSVYLLHR